MKKAIEKNIFEEINRTIELKNKLTVAKNNINKVIVRGGGVRSEDLLSIPENIQDMVNQYSKIAFGEYNQKNLNNAGLVRIPVNLTFNPKRFFVMLNWENLAYGFADSTKNNTLQNALSEPRSSSRKSIYVWSANKDYIEVGNGHNSVLSGAIKFIWIAIG